VTNREAAPITMIANYAGLIIAENLLMPYITKFEIVIDLP